MAVSDNTSFCVPCLGGGRGTVWHLEVKYFGSTKLAWAVSLAFEWPSLFLSRAWVPIVKCYNDYIRSVCDVQCYGFRQWIKACVRHSCLLGLSLSHAASL